MNERQKNVAQYYNGKRTSAEIALLSGDSAKYAQEVSLKYDLPRLPQAPRTGKNNPSYKTGRTIDRDGYVLVSAPLGHPNARMRSGRKYGRIYEHRLMMEQKLGRYLESQEIVDHIDGLRLHNSQDNLRLFENNAEHLRKTITGKIPKWSEKGYQKLKLPVDQRKEMKRIDTYHQMKVCGDARLRQILLAMLQLGTASTYLLGTTHHLEKAEIYDFSHSNLQHELNLLSQRYA